jgi:hypothetical protein
VDGQISRPSRCRPVVAHLITQARLPTLSATKVHRCGSFADALAPGEALGDITDPTLAAPTTVAKLGGCLFVVNSTFHNFEEPNFAFNVSALPIPAECLGEEDAETVNES